MKKFDKEKFFAFWGAPLMLLVLLVLSYGLMIPWLGYGFDEWHFIYYSTRGAQGIAELFHYDGHPQAAWSYVQSFNVLGYAPIRWHLYALFWRWLAVVSFWLCLKTLWPVNHRQNFVTAALFAVHPIFTLQIFPITFFEIWFGYTLLFLSFFFNILAIQKPKKQRIFMLIAIALAVGHVFTKEYAWFVELMRPVFIWFALPSNNSLRKRINQVAKIWLPFFAIFLSFLVWRGFFYTPLRKYFRVQDDIFTNPLQTILGWTMDLLPDIGTVLFTSWYKTFNSEYVYMVRPFNIALFVLTALVMVFYRIYLKKITISSRGDEQWARQAIFLGLPSLLFGIVPFYIASYSLHLTEAPLNSRLTIGMLPGAALITVALLEIIISKKTVRILMAALVLSLSVGWHIRYTNDYRKVLEYQYNFLQQMIWRIPGMEKNTAVYVIQSAAPQVEVDDAEIVFADFAMSMAINSIYQLNPLPADDGLSFWYSTNANEILENVQTIPLHFEHATTYFTGNSSDSLLFYYDPLDDQCLHLVGAMDQYYKRYPDEIRKAATYPSAARVLPEVIQNKTIRDDIFQKESTSWCYYYQKADLARQEGQWQEIPLLWEATANNGLKTSYGTEYLPFIEGFARLGKWQKALEISIESRKLSKAMDSILCPLWDQLQTSTPDSKEKDLATIQVREKLKCTDP